MEKICKVCKKKFSSKKSTQKFCSFYCFIYFRNHIDNPAKKLKIRKKISESAKKRGTKHLNTFEIIQKRRKTITGKGHWNWQGGKSHPKCIDCGKVITFQKKRCKKCNGIAIRGKNSPNWKGGINPLNKTLRNRTESLEWRKAVFQRDNYTCVWCGIKSGIGLGRVTLNADHIKPFSLYPEHRFDLKNGRTLCIKCHRHRHSKKYCYKSLGDV